MWSALPHAGCDLEPVMSLPQFPHLLMEVGGRESSWRRCSGLGPPGLNGTLMKPSGLHWGPKAGLRQAGLGGRGGSGDKFEGRRGEGTSLGQERGYRESRRAEGKQKARAGEPRVRKPETDAEAEREGEMGSDAWGDRREEPKEV